MIATQREQFHQWIGLSFQKSFLQGFFLFSKENTVGSHEVEACVPKDLLLYKSHDRQHHNYPQIFASVKLFSSWGGLQVLI